jgi:protoporphyrinogen/coproporphyrinogen III oxidase
MKRIAIIGGGISGLSAAHTIEEKRQSGTPVEYVLFESSPRLGGVLVTDHVDGCLVEAGPDSFLTEKPWAADLCRKIGLGDQLIGSNDAERKTYIVARGKLVVMPDGLMFMVPTKIMPTVFSPLFSLRTKMRMAAEWFHPPHKASEDETVAQMVERHYGSEMVDLLADPLLSGVYGGEASQLSVRAVLPRFADMESKHGSLGRAMLTARKDARRKMGTAPNVPARPLFSSLKDGMQQMTDALVARLDANALKTSSPVQSVITQDGGWTVSAGYQSDQFDAVIIATPTHAAAAVLQATDEILAREMGEIHYTSSVTVTLGYDEKSAARFHRASDFWCRAARADVCSRPPSSTTNFLTAHRRIAPSSAAFSAARATSRSCNRATKKFSRSFAANCGRLSASMPNRCLRASTNGSLPWRSIPSATSNACSASKHSARNFPAWRSRATAIAASASPTVCAPAPKRPARSWPRWGCGRLPSAAFDRPIAVFLTLALLF